jgi:hypothetical protein
MSKLYYGIKEVPTGFRRGSMKEALDAKQVRYYGLKKIDNVLIQHQEKQNEEHKKIEKELLKLAGEKGTLSARIKKLKILIDTYGDNVKNKNKKKELEKEKILLENKLINVNKKFFELNKKFNGGMIKHYIEQDEPMTNYILSKVIPPKNI